MRKEEERTFFSLFKNCGVADLCVQALTVKYDLDKHICNSNESHSEEEKSILYGEAVKAIKVAETALNVDFDKLLEEIDSNLEEVEGNERLTKKYCHELLATFGTNCSYVGTCMPSGNIVRAKERIKQYEKYKRSWKEYQPQNEQDRIKQQNNIDSYDYFIDCEKQESQSAQKQLYSFFQFYVARNVGIVENCYSRLLQLLQEYANILDWLLLIRKIDLFALQDEYGIYIKDPRMERSAAGYIKWAGTEKVAQKYIDDLHSVSCLSDKKSIHYHKDEEAKAIRQFKRLVKDGYFSPEASLDDWLYIYGVKGKMPNEKPLEWQKTQKELAYMVRHIWQNTDTKMWVICEAVFTIKGKKPNTDVMKSDLSSIENGYKNRPETFDRLDKVLKD